MNNMIDTVENWLETQGIESETNYDEGMITYIDDEDETVIFCYLNDVSLNRVIDYDGMYDTNEIN